MNLQINPLMNSVNNYTTFNSPQKQNKQNVQFKAKISDGVLKYFDKSCEKDLQQFYEKYHIKADYPTLLIALEKEKWSNIKRKLIEAAEKYSKNSTIGWCAREHKSLGDPIRYFYYIGLRPNEKYPEEVSYQEEKQVIFEGSEEPKHFYYSYWERLMQEINNIQKYNTDIAPMIAQALCDESIYTDDKIIEQFLECESLIKEDIFDNKNVSDTVKSELKAKFDAFKKIISTRKENATKDLLKNALDMFQNPVESHSFLEKPPCFS